MQLFKSEPLVMGGIYSACLCNGVVGEYEAIHPPGKSFLTLREVGKTLDISPDFFDWWTSDKTQVEKLKAQYAKAWEKVEEKLQQNRKVRL